MFNRLIARWGAHQAKRIIIEFMLQIPLVNYFFLRYFYCFSQGSWFTFIGTSIIIVIIGGLFGAFRANLNMKNLKWHLGSYKQKILRIVIAYILLIPSWILQYYLPNIISNNLVTSFLINEFFLNMMHFALIVYLMFGYVPFYILKKLKLTNQNENMEYNYLSGK